MNAVGFFCVFFTSIKKKRKNDVRCPVGWLLDQKCGVELEQMDPHTKKHSSTGAAPSACGVCFVFGGEPRYYFWI